MESPGHEPNPEMREERNIRVLVLGVGNDMMGDEGVGVRVARELNKSYAFPGEVEVVDGGVGGLALLPLIRSADEVVIIDAIDASARAGSIFMFNSEELDYAQEPKLSLHDTGIMEVLKTAALMNEELGATIIGVQPKKMDEFGAPLSKPVARNLDRVIEIVLDLLASKGLHAEPRGSCSLLDPSEWNG